MLSSIFISGRLGEVSPGGRLRYVEIDRVIAGSGGSYSIDKIPVATDMSPNSLFYTAPIGSKIVLKGRLQVDERGLLYVVSEIDEISPLTHQETAVDLLN